MEKYSLGAKSSPPAQSCFTLYRSWSRNGFYIFKSLKKIKKNNILWHVNLNGIQISVFIETQPCPFIYTLYITAFILRWQNWVLMTDCMWCSQYFRLLAACVTEHSDIVTIWQHFKCQLYFCIVTILFFATSARSSCKNKRKLDLECCTFRAQWSVSSINKMQSIMFNMQGHYSSTKKIQMYIDITILSTQHDIPNPQKSNGQKIRTFKMEYLIIAKFFCKNKNWKLNFNQNKFSSGLFVKQRKPHTNSELIKLHLIAIAEEMCSEKLYLFD